MTDKFWFWMNMFDDPKRHGLRGPASEGMVKEAHDFACWKNLFYRADKGDVYEKMALLEMAALAKTFGQTLNVYWEAINLGEIEVAADCLEQLIKLADDPQDADQKSREAVKLSRWKKIFEISPLGSEDEVIAQKRIIELMLKEKKKEAMTKGDRTKI